MEFSPRKAAGDLDFWGGALVLEVMEVSSDSDALMPSMLKASEAPSVGGKEELPCRFLLATVSPVLQSDALITCQTFSAV